MAARGFTLLELLVVLALAALIIALVPPMLSRGMPGVELKAAARDVAAGLREARSRSLAGNAEVLFTVDVESRSFAVAGGRSRRLPGRLTLSLYTAERELVDSQVGSIRFFPDGSSTGGGVRLSSESGGYDVTVDWLTGQVAIRR